MRTTVKTKAPRELKRLRQRQRWSIHRRSAPPVRLRGHMARGSGR